MTANHFNILETDFILYFHTSQRRKMSDIKISYHSLGSLVTVNSSFLGEPAGVIAYVYEVYDKPGISGISLITQNGVDLGGFNIKEQAEYLSYYGDTGQVYNFKNVTQLHNDWRLGVFKFFSNNPAIFKHTKPLLK